MAVVQGAKGLSEGEIQRFAKWTNLAETTFLQRPTDPAADYRVRFFTASQELPFAGHPALRTAFAAPSLTRYEPVDEPLVQQIAQAIGVAREGINNSSWLVNGPQWIGVRLSTAQEVLALNPDTADLGSLAVGVVGPHEPGHDANFEVRAFSGGDSV